VRPGGSLCTAPDGSSLQRPSNEGEVVSSISGSGSARIQVIWQRPLVELAWKYLFVARSFVSRILFCSKASMAQSLRSRCGSIDEDPEAR